jgi:nucleoside-diphosphate-sugar epimerase
MPWNEGKARIRDYLKELNKDKKVGSLKICDQIPSENADALDQVLEYTIFVAGLFTSYLTHPYNSTKHVHPMQTPFDFGKRRLLMVEGSDNARITLTTVTDIANVVAKAVEYEGEWPVVGGIRGDDLTMGEVIKMGERIRGESIAAIWFIVDF